MKERIIEKIKVIIGLAEEIKNIKDDANDVNFVLSLKSKMEKLLLLVSTDKISDDKLEQLDEDLRDLKNYVVRLKFCYR